MDRIDKAKNSFSKFKDKPFRKYQKKAIEHILDTDKKFVMLEGPPGSGKSLIGAITGLISENMVYLTQTKALQQQIWLDFPHFRKPGFSLLKGRNNYPCYGNNSKRADECVLKKCSESCEYKICKKQMLANPLRILNYSYFLTETNYVDRSKLSGIPFAIFDEADVIEHLLSNFVSLAITQKNINMLKIDYPKYKTSSSDHAISNWKTWAKEAAESADDLLCSITTKIDSFGDLITDIWQFETIKEKKNIESLLYKLQLFIKYVDKDWIYEENSNRYGKYFEFKPTWIVSDMADEYLFNHIEDKIVFMSAKFPPIRAFCHMLGLKYDNIRYINMPSTFPPENTPIYINSVSNLKYDSIEQGPKEKEIDKLCKRIVELVDNYENVKGLIHCTNYKLRNKIIDYAGKHSNGNLSEFGISDRYMTHNREDREEMLLLFKSSKDPLVMVSPSMERGISLDGDFTRFIIVAKCPYPSLADKKIKQRVYGSGKIGSYWYKSITIQTLIQAMKRGTRSENDYCDVWLLDEQIKLLIFRNLSMFPQYIKDSFTTVKREKSNGKKVQMSIL